MAAFLGPARGNAVRCLHAINASLLALSLKSGLMLAGIFVTDQSAAQTGDSTVPTDNLIFEAALPGAAPVPAPDSALIEPAPAYDFYFPPNGGPAREVLAGIAQYRDSIEREIQREGPYASGLVQLYFDLGLQYQTAGQHEQAIETFEEAQYINRINNGLVTEALFNLVKAEIASHLALGDLASVNREQQYLYYLGRERYGAGSMEIVPVLNHLGDWHMTSFSMGIVGRPSVSISISSGMGSDSAPDPRRAAFGNLYQAQRFYGQAIVNLLRNDGISDPALLELERKLIEATFFSGNISGFLEDQGFYLNPGRRIASSRLSLERFTRYSWHFRKGRDSYQRMREYLDYRGDASAKDIAGLLIEEADWHLLYDHHSTALERYEEAIDYMRTNAVPEDELRQLIQPALPVKLPVFTALPHSREIFGVPADRQLDYLGYFDVRISLSRYGSVRGIDITGRHGNVDKDMERRLKLFLRSTPFRPRILEDGAGNRSFDLRYYVADAGLD